MAEFQAAGKERRLFRTAGILFIIIAASTIVLRLLTDILLYNYGAGTLAQLTGGTLGFTALLYIFIDIAHAARPQPAFQHGPPAVQGFPPPCAVI